MTRSTMAMSKLYTNVGISLISAVASRASWASALVALIGCGSNLERETADSRSTVQNPIVNGEDDRLEVYELPAYARERVTASVAALIWSHRIEYTPPEQVELRAPTLQEAAGVCPDEAFAKQPSAALCTAVLVDRDLVLTAAHCLGAPQDDHQDRCQRLLVVFDYDLRSYGETPAPGWESFYSCRQVVFERRANDSHDVIDFALLQLDRPTTADRVPVKISEEAPRLGESLMLASYGAGLPLKIEQNVLVTSLPEGTNYFVAETDTFGGSSGGPLFNTAFELVGHHVRGQPDWQVDGECLRAARSEASNEQQQLERATLAALCQTDWPTPLCDSSATCGDRLCAGSETLDNCPGDCTPATCGDGLCEYSERLTCAADCQAYRGVPDSFPDDPKSFHAPAPSVDETLDQVCRARGGCSLPSGQDCFRFPWVLGLLPLAATTCAARCKKRKPRRSPRPSGSNLV